MFLRRFFFFDSSVVRNLAHCSLVVRGRSGLHMGFLCCLWFGSGPKVGGGLGPIWWFPDDNLRILQCIDFKFHISVTYVCGKVGIVHGHYSPTHSHSVVPKEGGLGPFWWFLDDNLRKFQCIDFKSIFIWKGYY